MPDLDPDRARPGGLGAVAVVGDGRVGRAVAAALRGAGVEVTGPLGRGATAAEADIVLLAVPDAEIGSAAALVAPGRLVGHFSGATTLEPLAPHEALGIHPLMTVTGETSFAGVPAAVAGSTPRALERARAIAEAIGMTAFEIADADRAAYHAAASIASNFLVTLEVFAEELAATAGVPRDALGPLAQAALDNWRPHGAAALTGPIARGDEGTVSRQREAVHDRLPARAQLFDALTAATRDLAARELRGATS
jgi:predicted short-subunit dehydrogenase-like oxidoreductase (DUF2520 family)